VGGRKANTAASFPLSYMSEKGKGGRKERKGGKRGRQKKKRERKRRDLAPGLASEPFFSARAGGEEGRRGESNERRGKKGGERGGRDLGSLTFPLSYGKGKKGGKGGKTRRKKEKRRKQRHFSLLIHDFTQK